MCCNPCQQGVVSCCASELIDVFELSCREMFSYSHCLDPEIKVWPLIRVAFCYLTSSHQVQYLCTTQIINEEREVLLHKVYRPMIEPTSVFVVGHLTLPKTYD